MVVASSIALRASSGRPSSARQPDWFFTELARPGRSVSGWALGQGVPNGHGLVDRGQGVLSFTKVGEAGGLVVQDGGEAGQVRIGPRLRQGAPDGHGLVDRGQGVLSFTKVGEAGGLVVQGGG